MLDRNMEDNNDDTTSEPKPEPEDETEQRQEQQSQTRATAVYKTMSWEQRSKAIFFYLHPALGHLDAELTCLMFNNTINVNTFKNWVNQKRYYEKWVPLVETYTVADVLPSILIPPTTTSSSSAAAASSSYSRDTFDQVDPHSKVTIIAKYKIRQPTPPLPHIPPPPPEKKRRGISYYFNNHQHDNNNNINQNNDHHHHHTDRITQSISAGAGGRGKIKHAVQESFIMQRIVEQWEMGQPLSRSSAYKLLLQEFKTRPEKYKKDQNNDHNDEDEGDEEEGDDGTDTEVEANAATTTTTDWERAMHIHSGTTAIHPAFSTWLRRVITRLGYSAEHKETIAPAVPTHFVQVCLDATLHIRETMAAAGVTRLLSADEMFLQYYPQQSDESSSFKSKRPLICPQNAHQRVRNHNNRAMPDREKHGCTVMVACEMFESRMLAPFIIMTGDPNGAVSRRFADWDGISTIRFHPSYRMDADQCGHYLQWLRACYPDENIKLGLIWDTSCLSSHVSEHVMQKAAQLNIVLGEIPAACTSLIQICNVILQAPIQQAFQRRYTERKSRKQTAGVSTSFASTSDAHGNGTCDYNVVDRADVICWLEQAFEDVDDHQISHSGIAQAFKKYGQDHRALDGNALVEYLSKHDEHQVYKSLLRNQQSLDLTRL